MAKEIALTSIREGGMENVSGEGECDWTAGILACMSVTSTRRKIRGATGLDAAEATALQAGMPALQSHSLSARYLIASKHAFPYNLSIHEPRSPK